jgi:tetratricopeptide (TPR) repeat protein
MRLFTTFRIVTALSILTSAAIATGDRAIADNISPVGIKTSYTLAQSQKQADELLLSGNQKLKQKNYTGAIADFSQSIQLAPNFEKALYNRAVAYDLSGNRQQAIDDYDRVIKLNPRNVNSYFNRAVAKAKFGDNQGALSDYNRVIEIDPKAADAYLNRGNLLQASGYRRNC